MSGYEPGTVALATVDGVPNVRLMRGGKVWMSAAAYGTGGRKDLWSDRELSDVRPLVVLDPDDGESAAFALRRLHALEGGEHRKLIADNIDAQTAPPKPAEPVGLGGVVRDREGVRWVRTPNRGRWVPADIDATAKFVPSRQWDAVDAVEVLSEGVTP